MEPGLIQQSNKKGRMMTSTPVGYRTRQESSSPEPFDNTVLSSDSSDTNDDGHGGAKTGISRELEQTKMTPSKLEPVEKRVARERVAMKELDSSDIFFKKRSKTHWSSREVSNTMFETGKKHVTVRLGG